MQVDTCSKCGLDMGAGWLTVTGKMECCWEVPSSDIVMGNSSGVCFSFTSLRTKL